MATVSLLRAAALGLVVLASALPAARSWSKEGHMLTCQIAQDLLEPDAAHAVRNLLPDDVGGDLSALCVWPDQVRHWYKYSWTGPLHFIDTPDKACSFDYSRDCHGPDGAKDMCVAGAIANFTSQLLHYKHGSADRKYNLTEALLFLSHFMGDVHQPMHVGFTSDQGGNSIELRWFRHKSNLHHSEDYPDVAEEWSATTTGFRFPDTYQAVARKALRRLCQIYEEPIARTPMKYFPPEEKNRPTWIARMEALQGQEGGPIIRHLTTYLLTLDEEYDRQAIALRNQIHRAKQAERFIRKLLMENARAQARLAVTLHWETSLAEAVKTLKDRHAEELKHAYLVTRSRCRMFAMHGTEPAVLEGIPLYLQQGEGQTPPTPSSSPARATIYEPLSQPPPGDEDPLSASVNGPAEP